MITAMNSRIKISALLLLALLPGQPNAGAQDRYPYAAAGPQGNYVMCSNRIPKGFTYQVMRSVAGANRWEQLGNLTFASTFDEFYRDVAIANGHNNLYALPLEKYKGILWQMIQATGDADSIPVYGPVPMYREALGTTYYDMTAKPGTSYVYKVVTTKPGERDTEAVTDTVKYPAPAADYKIRHYWQNALETHVNLRFNVENRNRIYTAKAFRRYYMQTDFVPVQSPVGLSFSNDSLQAWVIDTTTVKRSITQYFIVPYDLYGNPGRPSDTAKVVNLIEKAESMISGLHSSNNREERSIILSWQCAVPEFLRSIDVYRSEEYETGYRLIGSAAPKDTTFTDQQVNPITTYYYYLVINNAYGQSGKSARIAGMLEASRKAVAPHDLKAETRQGMVVLTWKRPSDDTRGYYVMRSDDGSGKYRQLGNLLITDSLSVVYIDTLTSLNRNSLAYAITAENTSYDISPMTEPVYVNPVNTAPLTTPVNLVTHYRDSLVLVAWDETAQIDPNVLGYRLMRKILRPDGTDSTAFGPLAANGDILLLNYFEDRAIKEGVTYAYQVAAIGSAGVQSEGSIPSVITIPLYRPVSLASVAAVRTDREIVLSWEPTRQPDILSYRVYRLQEGSPPVLLATLPAGDSGYTDATVQKDVVYVYAVTCLNARNIESRIVEWTGLR